MKTITKYYELIFINEQEIPKFNKNKLFIF